MEFYFRKSKGEMTFNTTDFSQDSIKSYVMSFLSAMKTPDPLKFSN